MSQVTIYMDNKLEAQIKKLAQNANVSISKFISQTLEQNISSSWNSDIKSLSGSWSDVEELDLNDLRKVSTKDIPRESF